MAYVLAVVIMTAVTSYALFLWGRHAGLPVRASAIKLAAANAGYCLLFPAIFVGISGKTADGAPALEFVNALVAIFALTLLYAALALYVTVARNLGYYFGFKSLKPEAAKKATVGPLAQSIAETGVASADATGFRSQTKRVDRATTSPIDATIDGASAIAGPATVTVTDVGVGNSVGVGVESADDDDDAVGADAGAYADDELEADADAGAYADDELEADADTDAYADDELEAGADTDAYAEEEGWRHFYESKMPLLHSHGSDNLDAQAMEAAAAYDKRQAVIAANHADEASHAAAKHSIATAKHSISAETETEPLVASNGSHIFNDDLAFASAAPITSHAEQPLISIKQAIAPSEPGTAKAEPPTAEAAPPIISPEPPIATPEPATAEAEPPTTEAVPPIIAPEPPIATAEPPTTEVELPIIAPEPPIATPEPATAEAVPPTTEAAAPIIAPEPPIATAEPPIATPEPATAETALPSTEAAAPIIAPEPPIATPEPATAEAVPPTTEAAPPIIAPEPPIATAEPPFIMAEPPIATTEPTTAEAALPTAEAALPTAEAEPLFIMPEPPIATAEPATAEAEPPIIAPEPSFAATTTLVDSEIVPEPLFKRQQLSLDELPTIDELAIGEQLTKTDISEFEAFVAEPALDEFKPFLPADMPAERALIKLHSGAVVTEQDIQHISSSHEPISLQTSQLDTIEQLDTIGAVAKARSETAATIPSMDYGETLEPDEAHSAGMGAFGPDEAHSASMGAFGPDEAHSAGMGAFGPDEAHSAGMGAFGPDEAHSADIEALVLHAMPSTLLSDRASTLLSDMPSTLLSDIPSTLHQDIDIAAPDTTEAQEPFAIEISEPRGEPTPGARAIPEEQAMAGDDDAPHEPSLFDGAMPIEPLEPHIATGIMPSEPAQLEISMPHESARSLKTPQTIIESSEDSDKNVDSGQNVATMGIIDVLRPNFPVLDVGTLIKYAYDCLEDGKLEDAAELFDQAIAKKPTRQTEFKIAIQLCNIYKTLGCTELALDILVSYRNHYRADLGESDTAEIIASILEMGGALDA